MKKIQIISQMKDEDLLDRGAEKKILLIKDRDISTRILFQDEIRVGDTSALKVIRRQAGELGIRVCDLLSKNYSNNMRIHSLSVSYWKGDSEEILHSFKLQALRYVAEKWGLAVEQEDCVWRLCTEEDPRFKKIINVDLVAHIYTEKNPSAATDKKTVCNQLLHRGYVLKKGDIIYAEGIKMMTPNFENYGLISQDFQNRYSYLLDAFLEGGWKKIGKSNLSEFMIALIDGN